MTRGAKFCIVGAIASARRLGPDMAHLTLHRDGTTSGNMPPALAWFVTRVFPLLFVAVGVVMLVIGVTGLRRAVASTEWPTTQGEILSSEVERVRRDDHDRGPSTTFHARIRYGYSVGGEPYTGDRVGIGDYGTNTNHHARSVVRRYPVGSHVTVYYDPDRPRIALLEPGVRASAFIVPGIGAAFVLFGGLCFVVFLLRGRKQNTGADEPVAESAQGD